MPESNQDPDRGKRAGRFDEQDYPPAVSIRPEYTITTIYPSRGTPLHPGDPGPADREITLVSVRGVQGDTAAIPFQGSHQAVPGASGEPPDWRSALAMPVDPVRALQGNPQNVRLKSPEQDIPDPQSPSGAGEPPGTIRHPRRGPTPPVSERLPHADHMELPRGKFRTLRRKTGLLFLINDMRDEGFTGYCQVQHPNSPIFIVFSQGRILLAGYNGLAGNRALEAINAQKYSWVDAMLHDLDEKQIQLAIEFNPSWKITEDTESSFDEPGQDNGSVHTDRDQEAEHEPEPPGILSVPAGEQVPGQVVSEPVNSPVSAIPEASPNPFPAGTGEETAWRAALTMPVLPLPDDSLVPEERSPGREDPGIGAAEKDRDEIPLSFEPLVADSELFESDRKRVKPVRTAVPEPGEQWRAMTVNRQPNNTV